MLVPKLVCLLFHTSQTRLTNLLENVLFILKRFGSSLIRTGSIIGRYNFIIILLEFLILIILKINYEKNKKIIYPKKIILILWSSIIFAYIPSILSSSAFEGMRIRMSIGMTIGLLFMYLGRNTTLLKLKEKNIFNILLIILGLFYITYTSYTYIYQEKTVHIVNELDKEFGKKLNDYIIEYEKENNIEIKYINLVVNAEEVEKSYYNEIKTYNIMTPSAFRTSWSAIGSVNYYTKRNLVEIKSYSNIKWYLENYDDSLGYLCKDEVLYISIYYL